VEDVKDAHTLDSRLDARRTQKWQCLPWLCLATHPATYNETMTDLTNLLMAAAQGDAQVSEQILPLVYDELRRLAAQKLAHEKPGQTLDATSLVHEAYLRLVGAEKDEPRWQGRGHFFAAASEAMRRILIENARRKKRLRHGGERRRIDLVDVPAASQAPNEVLAFDEALSKLAAEDPQAASVVKLRFYAGQSVEEAAAALGISRAQAYRHWTYARAWLRCALQNAK
jgi:RNA polymerase sigma factor (TIGR02999 family)